MDRVNCASPSARADGGTFPVVPGDTDSDAVSSSGCGVVPNRSDCIPLACIRSATAGFELATVIPGCRNRNLAHARPGRADALMCVCTALRTPELEPVCRKMAGALRALSPRRISVRRRRIAKTIRNIRSHHSCLSQFYGDHVVGRNQCADLPGLYPG